MAPEDSTLKQRAAQMTWGHDTLLVDPDLSQNVIARTSLSISSADTLRSCPARWAAEKALPTTDDVHGPAYIGNAGHDVLELLMGQPTDQRTPAHAAAILNDLVTHWTNGTGEKNTPAQGHRAFLNDLTTRTIWVSSVWAGIEKTWEILDPATIDVYATELPIDATLTGVPVGGFIDLVYRTHDKNGQPSLGIADWKTGKAPTQDSKRRFGDKHGDQIRIYAEAIEAMLTELPTDHPDHGLKVSEAFVFYTRHGKKDKVALSAPYRKNTLKAHADAWNTHNQVTSTSEYPAKESALCTYCPLVKLCPFRADNVKWDKVPSSALSPVAAPIRRPLTEAVEQTLTYGQDWDESFDAADPAEHATEPWDATDEDTTDPAATSSIDMFAPTEDSDPFARISDGIYTAARDPFTPSPSSPIQTENQPAHTQVTSHQHDSPEETTMSTEPAFFEDQPWKADPMNIASYAHLSANHCVNLALGQLRKAGVPAGALSQELLRTTADILWNVITSVQEQLIGHRDLQSATARNLIYSLQEILELAPMPILADGGTRFATSEEITLWGRETVARLGTMVSLSVALVHNGGNLGAASQFRGTPVQTGHAPANMNPATAQHTGATTVTGTFADMADEWDAQADEFDPAWS